MNFSVRFSREAEKDLLFLNRSDRKLFLRIIKKVEALEKEPRAGKPLVGNHKGEYSLRIGDYRIVYEINASRKIVFILTAKHRRHVY